jgi:hypothetical protein
MVKKKAAAKVATKTPLRTPTTGDDVKSALLVVSLTINAAILIAWITLQVTSKYDEQVTQFLMG